MIYLRLRSLQPICVVGGHAQGNLRRTLDYIPGSALRGAVAARLQSVEPGISQPRFAQHILAEGAQFHDLHPLPPGSEIAHILPSTARSCKLFSGFLAVHPEPGQPSSHGVYDSLLQLLRYQLAPAQAKAQQLPGRYCNHRDSSTPTQCDLPLEPFAAFYSGAQAYQYTRIKPNRRQITQTAIDAQRETASPGNLFTLEALEEGLLFSGYFALGEGVDELDFCTRVCPPGTHLRVGYGRTRGLGLMEVVASRVEEPQLWHSDLADLADRLEAFNDMADRQGSGATAGHTLFALTLLSDTIVLDPFFRSQAQIDGPTLGREVHPALAQAELLAQCANSEWVFGWSSPHGLPLPADRAIAAGSVFVFRIALELDALAGILTESDLEHCGMGERTAEGFGQVVVCHPFHLEVTPV